MNNKQLQEPATKADIKELREGFNKRFDSIEEDVSSIRTDVKRIVSFFDKEYLSLRKRVKRIEDHLDLPPLQQTS